MPRMSSSSTPSHVVDPFIFTSVTFSGSLPPEKVPEPVALTPRFFLGVDAPEPVEPMEKVPELVARGVREFEASVRTLLRRASTQRAVGHESKLRAHHGERVKGRFKNF